jgi:hypothetical protein
MKFFSKFLFTVIPVLQATAGELCPLPEPFDAHAVYARIFYVSPNGSDASGTGAREQPFHTLQRAVQEARPGTQIILREGRHVSGAFISNLRGEPGSPILISGAPGEGPAVFRGGTEAIHLSDPRYVVLQNLTVEAASGNGVNIDDAGTFETPAEYVILRSLTVRNIGPFGNRDGIKLSGLDHFRVENCTISRPGDGGSAIDMVGCHDGILAHNRFADLPETGIQAKGGSARLLIFGNYFESGGTRALNLGGSTGMQFFRPQDATFEAAHITAWANVIVDAESPVAFVGSENCLFAHNTVYRPRKWAARILQENNHPRLVKSRNNVYANNIVVVDGSVTTFVNVGPNTFPNTFIFENNFWFHLADPSFRGPNLPTREAGSIIQQDPLFLDAGKGDFHLQEGSPAIGVAGDLAEIINGLPIDLPAVGDCEEQCWGIPASVGAYAGLGATGLEGWRSMH